MHGLISFVVAVLAVIFILPLVNQLMTGALHFLRRAMVVVDPVDRHHIIDWIARRFVPGFAPVVIRTIKY